MTVLTAAAGLLLMLALCSVTLLYRLSVCNLRRNEVDGCAEAGFQLGENNIEMNIAETRDEHLLCFGIVFVFERAILFEEAGDALRNLFFIALCLRLHGHLIERLGIFYLFIGQSIGVCGESIVCICICKLRCHTEVAHADMLYLFLLFALEYINMGEFLLTARCDIVERVVFIQLAVHDLEERHLTDERVGNRLENEDGCFTVFVHRDFFLFVSVHDDFLAYRER